MKFLSKVQVESLSRFRSDKLLTTSFFLDTDKSRFSKKEILTAGKALVAEGRSRLETLDAAKEKKVSLEKDLDALLEYLGREAGANGAGLAVYACSDAGLFEDLSLPEPPRGRIIFDRNPYISPLTLILEEYHRLLVFLVDRREAKWYEVFMGEIKLLDEMKTELPKVVRGSGEREEKRRQERQIEAVLLEHYKKAAQRTFDLFKKNGYHGVVLGCPENLGIEVEPQLHAYIKERLKGWVGAKPADPCEAVLKEVQGLEKAIRRSEEEAAVKRLVAELEKGGRAVGGLKDALRALNQREVQTLIVNRNYAVPGKFCPRDSLLYTEDVLKCPVCERKTDAVMDVIDEAIEAAMSRDGGVRHVTPPTRLDHFGGIGAMLRFKS